MRGLGNLKFGKNLEVQIKAPLDARSLVALKSDLTDASTWIIEGSSLSYTYTGMLVVVAADPLAGNKGIYILHDGEGYTNEDNWEKLSNETSFEITGITMKGDYDEALDFVYMKGDVVRVDGSLYFCLIDNTSNIKPTETTGWELNWTLFQLKGSEGERGYTPTIGENGNWYINGVDQLKVAIGKDGVTPHVEDGYWYIGQNKTDVKAVGDTVTIDQNGFWRINGDTTNPQVQAKGQDGTNAIATLNYTGTYKPTSTYNHKDGVGYTDLAIGSDDHAYLCMVNGTRNVDPVGDTTGRWKKFIMSGAPGKNGLTPEIKDGLWWIGNENKNIKAEGSKISLVGGYWFINGEPTYQKAQGNDGASAIANINLRGNFDELLTYNNYDENGRADVVVGSDGNMYYSRIDNNTMNPVPFDEDAKVQWALFSMQGREGYPGANGKNGSEPYIALKNGLLMWWVKTPFESDGKTTYEYKCLDVVAEGMTPFIGDNLNWWIGNSDLGFKAVGQDAIANINYLGDWKPATNYYNKNVGANNYTDVVVGSNGTAYWAKLDSIDIDPVLDTDNSHWLQFVMKGANGSPGKGVLLSKSDTHILWKQVGDAQWTNLIAISDIKGEGAYSDVSLNVGAVIQWGGSVASIPEGWLLCDGREVDRVIKSEYRELIEKLTGTTTATKANIPDLRSRFIVGYDPRDGEYNSIGETGPVAYNLLFKKVDSLTFKKVRLKPSESGLPAHNHAINFVENSSGDSKKGIPDGDKDIVTKSLTAIKNNSEASAQTAHENRPPYYVTCFIIKASYVADMEGKTAYDVYLSTNPNPVLSKEAWLESLRGETGPTGINPKGDYDPLVTYVEDDVVRINNVDNPDNGNAFVCKLACLDVEPGLTLGWRTYWYPFVMRGAPGKDAFQLKIEYSENGTDWHVDATVDDVYCRFSTDNINFGAPINFKGQKGDDAYELAIQYSTDNVNFHDTATLLDNYARFSTDNKETWGQGVRLGGGSGTLSSDLTVNLSGGKTWGTLTSGTTIAAGTTYDALFRRALVESIPPTANVTASGSIPYNASSAILTLALSSNANNAGATIDSFVLSYKRDGAWIELYNGVPITTYSHSVDLSTDKTSSVTYRLVVLNTLTLSYTATSNIVTPDGYSEPTASGAITITKEIGDVSHRLTGSISQTSQNGVVILTRELQYSLNNSSWVAITTFNTNSFDYTHNDSSLKNSTIIYYRILVTCTSATGNIATPISMGSVSFVYKSTFGYIASTTPNLATLLSMGNSVLTNGKSKTIVATAGIGEYTYYSYNASAGDLTGIVMDGVAAVLGAFTKQADITGVNSFGATVTYRIYKSNAPKAFTNNQLVIS